MTNRISIGCAVAGLALLGGCAGMDHLGGAMAGGGNGRPTYTCPGGTYFDTSYDPGQTTMTLRIDGATSHPHTLNRVVDPQGRTLYQDAEYQLIPGSSPDQVTLVDRAANQPRVCSRNP